MPKPPLSHYSPKFANQPWANDEGYLSYYYDCHQQKVMTAWRGRRQWGRRRGLYSWKVERALNEELENEAAQVYKALLGYRELNPEERTIWAQFLLSQVVRTPTFLRYEAAVRDAFNITHTPDHDRVGCKECGDLRWVTSRDWCLLLAHQDDYFVRSDNPVLLSGFVERSETCLFYPLSAYLCFVACSMPTGWEPWSSASPAFFGYEMQKGGAHFINFHLARAAGESLILSPRHDGEVATAMFTDVIGQYPQPPFSLHAPHPREMFDAFESIRMIMSSVDGVNYGPWLPFELEPFPTSRPRGENTA